MADYGVLPTGFARKPLATILAEIEAQMITQFGPDVIQTAQSPLGQLNGLFANLVSQAWEGAEDIYQSYDPDQAEGRRLDTLGRLRLVDRATDELDIDYRNAITNSGQARIDIQDLIRAIRNIDGVTYAQIFLPEYGQADEFTIPPSTIVIAVEGGDESDVADAIRRFIVPGIQTWGNTEVSSLIDGYCRTSFILRPIAVDIELTVTVTRRKDKVGCPPPSQTAMKNTLLEKLTFINGDDVSFYRVRSVLESAYPETIEVTAIAGSRDELEPADPVTIGFTERAFLTFENITFVINDV